MNPTTWTCFDFGSAYIRVAQAAAGADPAAMTPLVVQFDGQPALRNVAYLTAAGQLQEVGEAVLRLDPATLDILRLRWGAAPAADPESEPGEAAGLLLAHIVAVLERDHRFVRDDPTAAALVAVPIVAGANEGPTLAARLQEVGFATATPEDSALAALAHETGGQPAPGRYGVIDVGAARTRLAIIDCRPNEAPVVVAREQISPGGRDFDDKLLAYFAPQWPPLGNQIESLARRATIEAFKRRFAEAWVDGQLDYATIETLGATQLRLSLDRDTFQSPAVAGPLIDTFCQEAGKFFDRHDPARALNALLLVGGGARWPFVADWAAQRVGPAQVRCSLYPERAVVLGLPRLAAWRAALATTVPAPGGTTGGTTRQPPATSRPAGATHQPTPRHVKTTYMAAGPATLLEFFGGLFGVLGLGRFLSLRDVPISCLSLLGWWATLALLLALGVASAVADRPELLIPLLAFWLSVPALSAILLYRRLRRASAA